MKSITIKLDERSVEIKKLPLGKYAELLRALKELPQKIGGLDQLTNDVVLQRLPELIAGSIPEVTAMLVLATDLKKEEIEGFALDEVVKIVLGIIEVNQYVNIYGDIKKVIASPSALNKETSSGSIPS